MTLTINDLNRLQQQHPELNFELRDGEIIIVSPSDYLSEEIGGELISLIRNWVKPRRLGRVTGSSAGFIFPNGDLLAPDVAFVAANRLTESPRAYAEVVPDFIVEIKSATDRIQKLEAKIDLFLSLGVKVAILIDPDEHSVRVFYPSNQTVELRDGDKLTLPNILPGWEVSVSNLWPLNYSS